jgi:hypothetical protein
MNDDFERMYESLSVLRINQHLPKRAQKNSNKFQVRLAGFMAKIHTRDLKI